MQEYVALRDAVALLAIAKRATVTDYPAWCKLWDAVNYLQKQQATILNS